MFAENGVMRVWVMAIENGASCCWIAQRNDGTGEVKVVFLT